MRMYHRGEIPPMDGDRSQGKSFPPRPPKSGQRRSADDNPVRGRMQKRRKPRLGKGIVTTTTTYLHHRSDKDTGSHGSGKDHQTYIPSPHRFHRRIHYSGTVRLPVYVGGISKLLKFIVMDKPAIYNAILGTPMAP
ncbi:unnamed protein product [Microthlaspi erraticum]|uniref:Uncharacterized protein n=1 Tax=Microthlaspi erraticum TaxID=1685480 RepID=A0A6D2JJI7_9BRAS|nr:unnamed protein product [Microthlaspi erraticum]